MSVCVSGCVSVCVHGIFRGIYLKGLYLIIWLGIGLNRSSSAE